MRASSRLRLAALTAALLAAPAAASAQLFVNDPVYPTAPIDGSDPLVGLPLRGATPAEYRAHLLWNLRAGLNVAALQCQFSPYLRTVDTYNALLSHHARELAAAYSALEGYFRRTGGREGPRQFDPYSTQTYNNFSTLQAQYAFCQAASRIGKEALARPRGQLTELAAARMREFRTSLVPTPDFYAFTRQPIRLAPLALTAPPPVDCSRLPRRERRDCERQQER
ncbi:MAG: hypothetical protein QOJ53_1547 [Sphingomonadales bacterium]|nr:hypothetical protein [Sphingomonadales bacterium]